MFIIDEETGTITLRQGDSAEIGIEDIPDDRPYDMYFSIYDINRKIMFELKENPINRAVTFKIEPKHSDLLTVPTGQKTANYFWAVKRCYEPDKFEDTLLIGDKGIADVNKVIVYPLIAEGGENAS
ncbi:MAG: hypothetical protein J6S67_22330 [Methanobrevibacter sp.]|nr:hypothetical protein [Methanobrevibacter sp.]